MRERLAKAVGPVRLVSGRLAGLEYAPEAGARRLLMRPEARAELRRMMRAGGAAASVAAAVENLALGGEVQASVAWLEKAREAAPQDARIASDLAAVYLAQERRGERPEAVFLALRCAEAARRSQPSLAEARFNLALSLEDLGLRVAAGKAFGDFLAIDGKSGWAAEARSRRSRLAAPGRQEAWKAREAAVDVAAAAGDRRRAGALVADHLSAARSHAEDDLLPRWADGVLAAGRKDGTAAGRQALAAARMIASEVAAHAGDAMLADAIRAIDGAADDAARLAALAAGHRDYAAASRLYGDRPAVAAQGFASAERALRAGKSPYAHWATMYRAACDYRQSRYQPAVTRLQSLAAMPALGRYPVLAGRTMWLRGLIDYIGGRLLAARKRYEAAAEQFARTGDAEHQATVDFLLYETLDAFGEDPGALRHLYRALGGLEEIRETRYRQLITQTAARRMLRFGAPQAAVYLAEESVRAAEASRSGSQIAQALRDLARVDHGIGEQDAALRAIGSARSYADRSGDETIQADVLVAEAEILGAERLEPALAVLQRAFSLVIKTHYDEVLADLYLLRGRMYLQAGERERAKADLQAGIARLEVTSGELDDASRLRFLEKSSALFDEMTRLAAESAGGAKAEAFAYAERGRGRALAWLIGAQGGTPRQVPTLAEVERRLPAGAALVEYAALSDRVLAWVVYAGGSRTVTLPVSPSGMQGAVRELRAALAGHGDFDRTSDALYRTLIAPLSLPSPLRKLVIIPDKGLHQVPFAALRDGTTGRYLIEGQALEVAPSATVYLHCAAEARARRAMRRGPPAVLVVADPAFDPVAAPSLKRLPGAAEEAVALARIHGRAEVVKGAEATRSRLLQGIGDHSIVHFSGHAEVDGSSPFLARLVLAPEGNDSGLLFASDLYGRRFPLTELVVLAACSTAAGQMAESEGVSGLVRPLLAAGVPAVVASLWAVDDDLSATLSIEFHRRLAQGEEASAALRGAMLAMLRSGSPRRAAPRAWAPFVLFGAGGKLEKGVT